jgi:hypothetical protein
MKDCTLGTPSMRDQLEIDALTSAIVMDEEAALLTDGAQVPPDLPRMPTTTTTRPSLETNALPPQLMPTTPTETTTATETEPAQHTDGAKEDPDDRHPHKH